MGDSDGAQAVEPCTPCLGMALASDNDGVVEREESAAPGTDVRPSAMAAMRGTSDAQSPSDLSRRRYGSHTLRRSSGQGALAARRLSAIATAALAAVLGALAITAVPALAAPPGPGRR